MNTVKKGSLFEHRSYEILKTAISDKRFGLDVDCCKIYQQHGYYSKDREGDIIFDLSIEIWPKEADRCHILYLCECKDYKGNIPVSDIEEFLHKIQQVAGHYVKGVFITTGEVQQGGLNLLRNKNIMLIKINADNYADIILYNEQRKKSAIQTDYPIYDGEALSEIRRYRENGSLSIDNWHLIIENFLKIELSAKVNWALNEPTEGLEYLSKKRISDLALTILNKFDYCIVKHGNPLSLKYFMAYLSDSYGLKFIIDKPFRKNKSYLNGYYDRRNKTIHINPELQDTGLFGFVIAHEIGHFFLHEDLKIPQEKYEAQDNSKYDPTTRKHVFEKEKHWIEWQANYFAGCLLMPHQCLLWQLIKWQRQEGISRQGFIWVDDQPCNVRDFKVAITQLAFIFGVSRAVLEIRMRELGMITYQKNTGYNNYSLFGDSRQPKTMTQILSQWKNKFLDEPF